VGATVFYNHTNELATVSNTFQVGGVDTDPTTVTLVITDPDGNATTYTYAASEIARTAAGKFTKDVSCASTTAGTWQGLWVGTGAASDPAVVTWSTVSTNQQDLYCTPEQLKSRTGISDSYDDREILAACRSVSRWIDEHCDRTFARRAVTLQLTPCGPYAVETPDIVSVTTLKTDDDADGVYETTWSASDFELQPVGAATQLEARPYTSIAAVGSRLFPITYGYGRKARAEAAVVAGWPRLPAAVNEAAAILTGDYLALGGMKFGVAGYGEYGAVRARISSPALAMLAPYRRYPILVG
jgi:hypothetical protein